jgi:hypothetical protein
MQAWIEKNDVGGPLVVDDSFILQHPNYLHSVEAEIARLTALGEALRQRLGMRQAGAENADKSWRHESVDIMLRYVDFYRFQWVRERERVYKVKIRVANLAWRFFRAVEQPENLELAGALTGLSAGFERPWLKIPVRRFMVQRAPLRPTAKSPRPVEQGEYPPSGAAARDQTPPESAATTATKVILTREEIMAKADVVLAQLKARFPDAKIGFRGSLARGSKGMHKSGVAFDPTSYDVDAFIVSDKTVGIDP